MWFKSPTRPDNYQPTQVGRILNRHKRGRPKFKLWQRLKSRSIKLVIPLSIFGVIGLLVYIADWFGVI